MVITKWAKKQTGGGNTNTEGTREAGGENGENSKGGNQLNENNEKANISKEKRTPAKNKKESKKQNAAKGTRKLKEFYKSIKERDKGGGTPDKN